jgi:hypothetical protein
MDFGGRGWGFLGRSEHRYPVVNHMIYIYIYEMLELGDIVLTLYSLIFEFQLIFSWKSMKKLSSIKDKKRNMFVEAPMES